MTINIDHVAVPAREPVTPNAPDDASMFTAADKLEPHHVAFRSDERAFRIAFGNGPDPRGGRGRAYFADPEGHSFEVCA